MSVYVRIVSILVLVSLVFGFAWIVIRAIASASALPDFSIASIHAWSFLLLCCVVAGLSMTFVQICRTLLPVRGYIQKGELERWLEHGRLDSKSSSWPAIKAALKIEGVSVKAALLEFERRSMNERNKEVSAWWVANVYDLPVEQLCGQLTVCFEASLDRPQAYPNFLLCLVGKDRSDDILQLLTATTNFVPDAAGRESSLLAEAQARSSLTRHGQLRVDAFQIETGGRWRRMIRLVVVATSILFSLEIAAGALKDYGIIAKSGYFLYAGVAGLVAGYMAMVLRDLIAIIELKRRQS